MITIATPSGTVRAVSSEAHATGSVRYSLTSAARGTVHVTATSSPARWDQFDAVRASLGSASAVRELARRAARTHPWPRLPGQHSPGAGPLRRRALGMAGTGCPWSTPTTAPRPSRPARR